MEAFLKTNTLGKRHNNGWVYKKSTFSMTYCVGCNLLLINNVFLLAKYLDVHKNVKT